MLSIALNISRAVTDLIHPIVLGSDYSGHLSNKETVAQRGL